MTKRLKNWGNSIENKGMKRLLETSAWCTPDFLPLRFFFATEFGAIWCSLITKLLFELIVIEFSFKLQSKDDCILEPTVKWTTIRERGSGGADSDGPGRLFGVWWLSPSHAGRRGWNSERVFGNASLTALPYRNFKLKKKLLWNTQTLNGRGKEFWKPSVSMHTEFLHKSDKLQRKPPLQHT